MAVNLDVVSVFWSIVIFLLGINIGSFLNVVIYRVPQEKSIISGRSFCPACQNKLSWLDLMPLLSFVLLKGKCRYCGEKISGRYFFVELLTAVVYLSLYFKYGISAEFIAFGFFMSILIAVFFIDLDHLIIPDGLVITGLIGGALLLIYHAFFGFSYFNNMVWWGPLVGMIGVPIILLVIAIVGSMVFGADAMGGGDVKLFAPIGLFLGWKMVLLALFASFVFSGIISIFLLAFKIKDRKDAIPFGPFIVLAVFAVMLFGHEFAAWYLGKMS